MTFEINRKSRSRVPKLPTITSAVANTTTTHRQITVQPGDLGTRFLPLDEKDGILNREVNQDRAKQMARHWREDEAKASVLRLWQTGPDTYKIIDGQHRITAVSSHLGRPLTIDAIIHPQSAFPTQASLWSALKASYNPIPQNNNDRFRALSAASPWPAIFKEYGLEPVFERKAGTYTWAAILAGRLYADASLHTGSVNANYKTKGSAEIGNGRDVMEQTWRDYPEAKIRETAQILKWWEAAAQSAYQRREKINTLFRTDGVLFALLLRACNPDNPVVAETVDKLSQSEVLGAILKGNHNVKANVETLLGLANVRRSSRRLTIFGEDGRNRV